MVEGPIGERNFAVVQIAGETFEPLSIGSRGIAAGGPEFAEDDGGLVGSAILQDIAPLFVESLEKRWLIHFAVGPLPLRRASVAVMFGADVGVVVGGVNKFSGEIQLDGKRADGTQVRPLAPHKGEHSLPVDALHDDEELAVGF